MADQDPKSEAGQTPSKEDEVKPSAIEHIRQALRGLRFGEVRVIVQNGVVVQIERLERTRLDRSRK